MITVAILINGNPIMARSCVNQAEENAKDETKYLTDANDVIWHKREDGAVKLAIKMLKTIKEQK